MAECLSQTKWRGKKGGTKRKRRAKGFRKLSTKGGGYIFWAGGVLMFEEKGIVHMRMKTCTLTAA